MSERGLADTPLRYDYCSRICTCCSQSAGHVWEEQSCQPEIYSFPCKCNDFLTFCFHASGFDFFFLERFFLGGVWQDPCFLGVIFILYFDCCFVGVVFTLSSMVGKLSPSPKFSPSVELWSSFGVDW